MAKNNNSDLGLQRLLGTLLIVLSIGLVPLIFLRFPQIAQLMQVFEDFGRVSDSIIATRTYIFGEILLMLTGISLGQYLQTKPERADFPLASAALLFLVWQIYRIVSDLLIFLAISG